MTSGAIRNAEGEDIGGAVEGLWARLSSQQDQLSLQEQREGKWGSVWWWSLGGKGCYLLWKAINGRNR